jgi:drug/metabolite transporter (DMT)-like permease
VTGTAERKRSRRKAYAVLALAVVGFSIAAPLIRLSTAHPLAIASWRLFFALVMVLPLALRQDAVAKWRQLSRTEVLLCIAAGVSLALHFWAWNTSVTLTTVAASVVLVNLQPALVAAGSAAFLGEPPSRRQWLGVIVAIAGAFVIAWGDLADGGLAAGRRALLGDLLAILGAATVAAYYLTGRKIRQKLELWSYVSLVYGVCLIALLMLSLFLGVTLWPQPPRELLIFVALAIGPMMLGHTGMNWALGLLPAFIVNLAVLGEPVGATILAMVIPGIGEVPSLMTLLGGSIVLAGIVTTAYRRPRTT